MGYQAYIDCYDYNNDSCGYVTKNSYDVPTEVERRGEDAHMCICSTMCDAHLASKYAEAYLKISSRADLNC